MKTVTKEQIWNNQNLLSIALEKMQDITIGLFLDNHNPDRNNYLPVIGDDDGYLTVLKVNYLLGHSTLHIGEKEGKYVKFPDGKSLSEMIKYPLDFHKWYKQNIECLKGI